MRKYAESSPEGGGGHGAICSSPLEHGFHLQCYAISMHSLLATQQHLHKHTRVSGLPFATASACKGSLYLDSYAKKLYQGGREFPWQATALWGVIGCFSTAGHQQACTKALDIISAPYGDVSLMMWCYAKKLQ